ncbi:MAG: Asp23/Gls24 family envelope stress response protein [Planctomycetota bacterium]
MLRSQRYTQICQEGGLLTVSRKVVKVTIQRIALDTRGVLELGGDSIWKRLLRRLGRRMGPRGIELQLADGEAAMTLNIVCAHGAKIPELANELRQRLRVGLKEQLGIDVRTVNVHVKSVKLGQPFRPLGEDSEASAAQGFDLLSHDPPRRRFELE